MVPKRLKDARLEHGLSQTDLAERLQIEGVNIKSKISNYETGKYSPPYNTVVAIAHALNYPECYFYVQDDAFAKAVLELFRNNHDPIENPYYHTLEKAQEMSKQLNDYLKDAIKTKKS